MFRSYTSLFVFEYSTLLVSSNILTFKTLDIVIKLNSFAIIGLIASNFLISPHRKQG